MSTENRGEWGSRAGFILAAIGSAIGLGNIWRFPYTVSSNGGGAFLIPYLIALVTAGIPILILEFALGHKIRRSAPGVFGKLNRKWQMLGWAQVAISFSIAVYYVVIIGWAFYYLFLSFNLGWGEDPSTFLFASYLQTSDSPLHLGGISLKVVLPLLAVWAVNYTVLKMGVKNGIEKANKIFMPLLILALLLIVLRGVTLPGAADGLDYFFKPDFAKLSDPSVWVAAYGQVFFSLSICFAIMIAYSSYLPKKSDIVNNAFITGFGNCSFSLISGIGVFSILGYMAHTQGVAVKDVAAGGVGLAFVVFPKAINALTGFNAVVGIVFFISLLFAGFSSSMSIIEAVVSAVSDKFELSRTTALNYVVGLGALVSLLFATHAGVLILDIVDYFANNIAIVTVGLIEVILLAWCFDLKSVREYVNPISDYAIGKWWLFVIKFLTPVFLGYMVISNIISNIKKPYGGYDWTSILVYGLGEIAFVVIFAIIFTKKKGKKDFEELLENNITELK